MQNTSESVAIEVKDLTKKYGELTAVDGINFTVNRGEVFGFLGPNGAGKTTTIRMLTGVFPADKGKIYLAGHNLEKSPLKAKERIGVTPEFANAYLDLTPLENILFIAKLYGLSGSIVKERAEELLDTFDLVTRKDDKVKTFSKGMKQRVILCMALINDPEIIFLDELTSGLDVQSTRLIRNIIYDLNQKGKTIFITTHNINEANNLCNRMAIINKGKIAAIDTPESLKATIKKTQSLEVSFTGAIPFGLEDLELVNKLEKKGDKYRLYTTAPGELISELVSLTQDKKVGIQAVNTLGPSLEDVFVQLTGGDNKGE